MEENSLRIANYNVSGGFYIGDESTEYLDREAVDSIDNKLQNQIINTINDEQIDIICFQEIITTKEVGYLKAISDKTALKFYDYFELSECNIVKDTMCGIAGFSKYPLKCLKKELFPNPRLAKTTSSGNTYYTFDKGYMLCEIEKENDKVTVLTHHGFPYRRFDSTPEENPLVFSFFDNVIMDNNPDIVTGDFNADDFMGLMEKTNEKYQRTINAATKLDGKKFDDILVRKGVAYSSKIIQLLSDHFMIVDTISGNLTK